MHVRKLTVGKGKITKPTEQEQQITYFELEMEITEEEVETARIYALNLINSWLNQRTFKTSTATPPHTAPLIDVATPHRLLRISPSRRDKKAGKTNLGLCDERIRITLKGDNVAG